MIRLNKYLAQCGLGSRRKCDQFIKNGRITINAKIVTTFGTMIDDKNDKISFDGKLVTKENKLIYILLNKPAGYVTTLNDELNRKTVIDLVPTSERIYPVGRLDKDTEGLLLFTNDGDLSYHLTHPKFIIIKKYLVKIDTQFLYNDLKKLEKGVMLDDGITAPCTIEYSNSDNNRKSLIISIHEGRKRQVRRMFKSLNYTVVQLKRICFANLTLNDLSIGKWRHLTKSEIKQLKKLADLIN